MRRSCPVVRSFILVLGLISVLQVRAEAASARWLLTDPRTAVSAAPGYDAPAADGTWTIKDPRDPNLILAPVEVAADREKYLLLDLEASNRIRLQVFFAAAQRAFSGERSFQPTRSLRAGRHLYEIPLGPLSSWSGTIRDLRLDLEQGKAGDRVVLHRLGVAEKPLPQGDANVVRLVLSTPPAPGEPVRLERMAAWHKTVAVTDEAVPNSAVFTYWVDRFGYTENNGLAKLSPVVTSTDKSLGRITATEAQDVHVEDTPGGVLATFRLEDTRVRTEIVPLFIGRGSKAVEGAALYRISTEPATAVQVQIGGGKSFTMIGGPAGAGLRSEDLLPIDGLRVDGAIAQFRGGLENLPVAIGSSATLATMANEPLTASFPAGKGQLVIAFAREPARAAELTKIDADAEAKRVAEYYDRLWATNRIETPEAVMNDAFRHALRTMEYTWIEPYGWLECIHHWYSLWHMQATAGAEWIGQTDRSQLCTSTHAEMLTTDGAVPQLAPGGQTHRDFGGSNQFWSWQARHYWQLTGDKAFVAKMAPALDKVLEQTSREYDKDKNLLLGWGLQIGNQEDYVATPYDGTTPSIEGINMMLTRAEFARALDDVKTAAVWEQRAARAQSLLRERLWMPELGRFAFFVDPHGSRRFDAQYHGLLYPVIWDVVDPLDAYTMLRHVHERLTGPGGEVYCSNNFPNHVGGTWGMQAGAAQQPWAAWAFSKAGQFEWTYQPLRAAARWAMDANHRGAWPEIALEPTPAYFSPPAGLYVAATVEGLFGLKADVPAGVLTVAPSFPSSWPQASMKLADYSAEFKRGENRLEYLVTSNKPLKRRLQWFLPPARIKRVLANDQPLEFRVLPAVNAVQVQADIPAETKTKIVIEYEPIAYECRRPERLAEGEELHIEAKGVELGTLDDRDGVLSRSWREGSSSVNGALRADLLDPYLKFGRLGQLAFSRRTFFVAASADRDACSFWLPVDMTVQPRYEIAQVGEVQPAADGLMASILLRNNTSRTQVSGAGTLLVGRVELMLPLDVPAGGEQTATVKIPANLAGLLTVGDNAAQLVLPGGAGSLDFTLSVTEPFKTVAPLAKAAQAGVARLPLDASSMIPDTQWTTLRTFPAYPHMPWNGARPPLEALDKQTTIACPDLPHVDFALPGRKFIPVSFKAARPSYVLDLKSQAYRKLFLLVVPFLDNHDTFSEVGRITVRSQEDIIYSRSLRFPGDVDWWWPPAVVGGFATVSQTRPDRLGLLPALRTDPDWAEGRPPAFPQPNLWCSSRSIVTASSVMSVVEIDLGRPMPLASLTLESIGVDPAFGLVAVTGLTAEGEQALDGTPWAPPVRYREPRTVFNFERNTNLDGWKLEGKAFSVATFFQLFMTPTLNSLAAAGEAATGKAISPDFVLKQTDDALLIQYHGGHSRGEAGPGLLVIDLVDSTTGQRLNRLAVNADHSLRWARIPVKAWAGKTVRLELVDENSDSSYAWLGVACVKVAAD